MPDTTITLVGNLASEPELRYTNGGGAPVANFTVASTPRTFDKARNEWVDGEPLFLRCTVWREAAESVAESLPKGARVVVTGRLKSRTFETRDGEKRTAFEVEVEEVGPSLRYATARIEKRQGSGPRPTQQAPAADPWATPADTLPPF